MVNAVCQIHTSQVFSIEVVAVRTEVTLSHYTRACNIGSGVIKVSNGMNAPTHNGSVAFAVKQLARLC